MSILSFPLETKPSSNIRSKCSVVIFFNSLFNSRPYRFYELLSVGIAIVVGHEKSQTKRAIFLEIRPTNRKHLDSFKLSSSNPDCTSNYLVVPTPSSRSRITWKQSNKISMRAPPVVKMLTNFGFKIKATREPCERRRV